MNKENEWEITANRYVAYIDIMGFKDMVARFSHDEIYSLMKKIDKWKKHVENIDWTDLKSNSKLVRTTTYSDSIMVYSKDDSFESLDYIISTVSGLINYLFTEGVPFKGALAFGTMTLDTNNSIFFGQPLIDAYLLQDELLFYGIIIHATVEQEMHSKNHKIPAFIKYYFCNLKNGSANHMTIYPLYTRHGGKDSKYKDEADALFESIEKLKFKTSGHLRKYIDNTKQYLATINQ